MTKTVVDINDYKIDQTDKELRKKLVDYSVP